MPRPFPSILIVLFLLLSACTPQTPAAPTVTAVPPTSTATVTASPTVTNTPLPPTITPTATEVPPTPTPAPPPLTHYTLTVDFRYTQMNASIQEQIVYANTSPDTLTELRLMIPPMAFSGAFSLTALTWDGSQAIENYTWTENGLQFPLPQPLAPGATVAFSLAYNLTLPSAASVNGPRPIPFSYSTRQANLVDWYPFVPPYSSGQGWLAHPNSYYGESLVFDLADFDITLNLMDGRNDLVIAASAPAQQEGSTYHYQLAAARNFAFSFSPEYEVTTQTVGDIEITSYYFPAHAKAGQDVAEISANTVRLFQERFAPYPHRTLAAVEAEFLDGMEYDGLFFVSKGMYNLYSGKPADYLTAIAAHETAHQWWYALIANDQAMEPWLDESLCTYSELIYFEEYAPEAAQWWWDVRINYYRPDGWVNSSVYDHVSMPDNYETYRRAIYLNGATFLHELRQTVGDEAFFAALQDYAQSYAGEIATTEGFFQVFAQHTQADLLAIKGKFFK